MKSKIIILTITTLLLGLLLDNNNSNIKYYIEEEAIPIRNIDKIIGLDYTITIPNNIKKNKIILYTNIIKSVIHYKNINEIKNFNIWININNSNNNYTVKKIKLLSKYKTIKKYNLDKTNNKYLIKINKKDLNKIIIIEFIKI